jgi:hypothetical protein
MKSMTVALILFLWLGTAVENSSAIATEPPESTSDTAKPVADAEPGTKKEREITLPPGFKEKKRGKFVLYCKREAPMGTRLKSETCLSETQMRDYILALETNKVDIDRVRAICSNPCVCGQPC